jgi:hypothetical protein
MSRYNKRDRIVGFRSNTSQRWIEDKRQPLDKVFSYQSWEDLLNMVDFDSKGQMNQEQIKDADQRGKQINRGDQKRNVRGSEHTL